MSAKGRQQGAGGRLGGCYSNSGPASRRENQLVAYLRINRRDEVRCMNLLQEYGVVSDNCVDAKDVHNTGEAIKWLYDHAHLL